MTNLLFFDLFTPLPGDNVVNRPLDQCSGSSGRPDLLTYDVYINETSPEMKCSFTVLLVLCEK